MVPLLFSARLGELVVVCTDERQLQPKQEFVERVMVGVFVAGVIVLTHRGQPRRWINPVPAARDPAGLRAGSARADSRAAIWCAPGPRAGGRCIRWRRR